VDLYGYGSTSLILKGEYRLRIFEKRLLTRMLRKRRDEVSENW
jgi:hypothetical protein